MPDVPEDRYKLGARSSSVKQGDGLALQAVGVRGRDAHRNEGADPLGPAREVHHGVAAGPSRELPVSPPAPGVDQDVLDELLPHTLLRRLVDSLLLRNERDTSWLVDALDRRAPRLLSLAALDTRRR